MVRVIQLNNTVDKDLFGKDKAINSQKGRLFHSVVFFGARIFHCKYTSYQLRGMTAITCRVFNNHHLETSTWFKTRRSFANAQTLPFSGFLIWLIDWSMYLFSHCNVVSFHTSGLFHCIGWCCSVWSCQIFGSNNTKIKWIILIGHTHSLPTYFKILWYKEVLAQYFTDLKHITQYDG